MYFRPSTHRRKTAILLYCIIMLGIGFTLACTPTSVPVVSSENAIVGPSTAPPEIKTELRIGALRGPTSMGLVKLMQEAEEGIAANDYTFTLAGAADEISAALLRGELDIAAIPLNLAAVLYNRTDKGVSALAINTLGALYILESGDSVSQIADLRGQTVYSTGKGTTPEFCLNYILAQNGIAEEDLIIEYRAEAAEIAALLEQGMAQIAVLPEPYITSLMAKSSDLRIALSFHEEWERVSQEGTAMVTGVTIVRNSVLAEHREAVEAFLGEYQASVEYTFAYPTETAQLIADAGIIPNAALAAIALPKCNIVFREGEEMQRDAKAYLQVLYEANPQAVGGALPEDDFYFTR